MFYSFLFSFLVTIIAVTHSFVIAVTATAANGSLRWIAELKRAGFNYKAYFELKESRKKRRSTFRAVQKERIIH